MNNLKKTDPDQKKSIRRVTVLHRNYFKSGFRGGGHYTTAIDVLYNISNKKLEEELKERNKGLRTCLWTVIGDYDFSRKRDQEAYFMYCLSCFYDPYTFDHRSADVGRKMVRAVSDEYYRVKE